MLLKKNILSEYYLYLFILFIISLLSFVVVNSGHFVLDEGIYYTEALRISSGESLYKDFSSVYPPLIAYLYVPFVYFFSGYELILSLRIFLFFFTFSSAIIFYFLSKNILGRKLGVFSTLLFILFNFVRYPFLNLAALSNFFLILSMLIIYYKDKLGRLYYMAIILSLSGCLFSKQNAGLLILFGFLLSSVVYSLFNTKNYNSRFLISHLIISIMPFVLLLSYLLFTHSLKEGLINLFGASTSYISIITYSFYFYIIHFLIILSILFCIYLFFRDKFYRKQFFFICLIILSCANLIHGVMRPDFVHLLDGVILLLFFLTYIIRNNKNKFIKFSAFSLLLIFFLICLINITTYWSNSHDKNLAVQFDHYLITSYNVREIFEVANFVSNQDNPYLFVYQTDTIFYSLTHKKNPTKYNHFYSGFFEDISTQNEVVINLSVKKPTIIINKHINNDKVSHNIIFNYIMNNSYNIYSSKNYEVRQFT